MEQIKQEDESIFLVISFFSPSGYTIRKNYEKADFVCYLPIDLPGNASRFLKLIKPALIIFIKYEFWPGYLNEIIKRKIPAFLISARFRQNQFLFGPAGRWNLKFLNAFEIIFTQDHESAKLLNRFLQVKTISAGDTRFDRVWTNSTNPKNFPEINHQIRNRKVLVCGSTWEDDEKIIFPFTHQSIFLIIAPHELSEKHIRRIEKNCPKPSLRYSELNNYDHSQILRTIIIDNIGMLMSLYKLADVSYVGGAFHNQLHNILEPAAMGVPVIFGPHTDKFPEGENLINAGGGFKIRSKQEFEQVIQLFMHNDEFTKQSGQNSKLFVSNQLGATAIIMHEIKSII
jgi:3-deoxy-D-manno-octulosonic-acid transferase